MVLSVFKAACTDDESSGINANRLKDVLKFGMQALRITRRAAGVDAKDSDLTPVKKVWKTEKLLEADEMLKGSKRFSDSPSLRSLWKQLLALAGAQEIASQSVATPTTGGGGHSGQANGHKKQERRESDSQKAKTAPSEKKRRVSGGAADVKVNGKKEDKKAAKATDVKK